MGGLAPSLNWWPGNQGNPAFSRVRREKYSENSGRNDSRERPAPFDPIWAFMSGYERTLAQ
jgi:hypothetical protein